MTDDKIRQGFRIQDANYLRKHDNPLSNPPMQIFSDEDPDEYVGDKSYYCAACKSKLNYLEALEEWQCSGCGVIYNTRIQDKPLKDIQDFKVTPHTDLLHYPVFDENDEGLPFVHSIDVDTLAGEPEEVELVKSSPDQRVQHLRVKGMPIDALRATKVMDD